ncbi:MAG: PPC domain-containing DNA-binding protein [Sedimentibacter sp.]|uniref:PPC domain-containing DNA-binding protein n=1 Tax=Sedimentibacter sp. TaxID=1960295 RepID=UPI0031591C04
MKSAKGKIKNVYAVRLEAGEDVIEGITKVCDQYGIKHGVIVSGIGSLSRASFFDPTPFPDKPHGYGYGNPIVMEGGIELISLSGVICENDEKNVSLHIHGTFADGEGKAYAGHLTDRNHVLITVEIVIGEFEDIYMARKLDKKSGMMLFSPIQI